jgi:hypothetical protein
MSRSVFKNCRDVARRVLGESAVYFVVGLGRDGRVRCYGDVSKVVAGDIRGEALRGMLRESVDLSIRINAEYLRCVRERQEEARVLEFKEARSEELRGG